MMTSYHFVSVYGVHVLNTGFEFCLEAGAILYAHCKLRGKEQQLAAMRNSFLATDDNSSSTDVKQEDIGSRSKHVKVGKVTAVRCACMEEFAGVQDRPRALLHRGLARAGPPREPRQ